MTPHNEPRDRILKAAFDCREELLAYARSLLGNYAAAEDAVQEAMLVVVRKHGEFQEGTSILAWCRSIVRIEVLRARQRSGRERSLIQRLLDDAVDAAFEQFQADRHDEDREGHHETLESCLGRVSSRNLDVLKARVVENLSYQQIGERVGMSLEAVRKSLFRVKKQVRACVETSLRGAQ